MLLIEIASSDLVARKWLLVKRDREKKQKLPESEERRIEC